MISNVTNRFDFKFGEYKSEIVISSYRDIFSDLLDLFIEYYKDNKRYGCLYMPVLYDKDYCTCYPYFTILLVENKVFVIEHLENNLIEVDVSIRELTYELIDDIYKNIVEITDAVNDNFSDKVLYQFTTDARIEKLKEYAKLR